MVRKNLPIMLLLTVGFVWTFLAGILVTWLIAYHTDLFPRKDPIDTTGNPTREEYDVLLVSKASPHKLLFIDYYKSGKGIYGTTHYYNGTSWIQGTVTSSTARVLPVNAKNQSDYEANGAFSSDGSEISFSVPHIYTTMTVRARNMYTKFGGATQMPSAKLTVDGNTVDCYAALLVGFNSTEDFADWRSLGVKTAWVMFFDKDRNFYHLDNTAVDKFSPLYESHSFFAKSGDSGTVTYYPNFSVSDSHNKLVIDYDQDKKLELATSDIFGRNNYGGVSWGGIAKDNDGGLGVYLTVDTHQ